MMLSRANLIWLLIYLLVMSTGVIALQLSRHWALTQLANDDAQSKWKTWQAETHEQAKGTGPVSRRTAKSPQPPTLVLLRDYYLACVGLFILLSTVLFLTLMFMLRGAIATKNSPLRDAASSFSIHDPASSTKVD